MISLKDRFLERLFFYKKMQNTNKYVNIITLIKIHKKEVKYEKNFFNRFR